MLRAEGEKQARALRAEGEAEALAEDLRDRSPTRASTPPTMLGYKYLEALPAVAAGEANKLLLLPAGAADAMGAVAGLGAAFADGAAPTGPADPKQPGTGPGDDVG